MSVTAVSSGSAVTSSTRPVLRLGSRGAAVRDLQARLKAAGFSPGPVDGSFGPRTRAAVRAFQKSRGLVADGIVGPKTWGKLKAAPAPRPTPAPAPASTPSTTLKLGSRGEAVHKLQLTLAKAGFNPGPADGIFGKLTLAAVKTFQASRGLLPDGVVGSKTSAALAKAGAPVPGTPPVGPPPPSGPVRDKIVALARAELARGVREDAGKDRDKAGRIVEYRRAVTGPGENPHAPEPWCADFASWIYRQAGVPLGKNGQGEDYVPYLRGWAQSAGRYHTRGSYTPKPGDLVIFSYGGVRPDHVAVVVKVENGRVHTIGGNESSSVKAQSYELGRTSILGYVTPPAA